jgi:putative transposase
LRTIKIIKKGDTTIKKSIIETARPSSGTHEVLEEMVRLKAQEYIQEILEDEVEAFLGRKKSERIKPIDGTPGYWNGHGKWKKFSVMNGTITVRRPRVRGTEERFESKIIPFFKRRSKEVGQLLPELYLHGLAKGNFDMALRGLLGEGAPLSASAIDRLKGKWHVEYEEWKCQDLSSFEVVYQWADGIYVKAGRLNYFYTPIDMTKL